jgi:GT2 family glycosyltransferase
MPAEVAILVVTYGHADEIEACLDGALAQSADQPVEVVVVDNSPTDETAEVIARVPEVRLVRSGENLGFAEGVNLAFRESSAPYVLLLNPDCVMDAGCVAALLAHLRHDPSAGAAAALLRETDGSLQLFARRDVSLGLAFWNFTEVGRRLDERRFGGRHHADRRYANAFATPPQRPLAVDVPAAACVLVAREHLGPRPMDPALPLFFNDADLFRRLRACGLRADIVPAATAAHGYGTSHRRLDADRRQAEFVASMWRYVAPWPAPRRAALWLMLVLDALLALALDAAGRGRSTTAPLARGTLGGLGLPGGAVPWISAPSGIRRPRAGAAARRDR